MDPQECNLRSDGLRLSSGAYSQLLARLAADRSDRRDEYLSGGAVEELELRLARELGKESALYVPTGSLANHLALAELATGRTQVLVPAESHAYRDAFAGRASLPGPALLPVAPGQGTFTFESGGLAAFPEAGALLVECPIRRRHGELFDFGMLRSLAQSCRASGLRLHLDGARLHIAAAYSGVPVREYAGLFDTVYVSLYKCFNAANGAILAGDRDVIERLRAARKRCGAETHQGWSDAAVALHFLPEFIDRLRAAIARSQQLVAELNRHPRLRVDPVPGGTNLLRLQVSGMSPSAYAANLERHRLSVRLQHAGESFDGVWLVVNESLNCRSIAEVAGAMMAALEP